MENNNYLDPKEFASRYNVAKLITQLRENKGVAKPEDLQFQGLSLRDFDLSGINLYGANFANSDLSGANLSNCKLFRANLSETSLVGANLENADLTGANLSNANLENAKCLNAGLGMANLTGTKAFNADLSGATLTKANLSGADLRCIKLRQARIREADLSGSDLTGADLFGADMSMTKVSRAIFNNADMRDCRLRVLTGYKSAQWLGTDIRDINFAAAYRLRRFIIDENYLREYRESSPLNENIYKFWKLTSDCGRSIYRWCFCILLEALLFAYLFTLVDIDYGKYDNWIGPIYYSIVTLSTLGYGDIIPASAMARFIAITEVVTGYLMLGGLLSIFSNKMARRGE